MAKLTDAEIKFVKRLYAEEKASSKAITRSWVTGYLKKYNVKKNQKK